MSSPPVEVATVAASSVARDGLTTITTLVGVDVDDATSLVGHVTTVGVPGVTTLGVASIAEETTVSASSRTGLRETAGAAEVLIVNVSDESHR